MNEQQEALNQLEALERVQSHSKMEERIWLLEGTVSRLDKAIGLLNKALASLQFQLTNQGNALNSQISANKETAGQRPPSVTD